jgi:transposase
MIMSLSLAHNDAGCGYPEPKHLSLFNNLPGAGKQLAPRSLTAFGSHRERFQCSLEALTFFGLAPVTEQSGKSKRVHFRWVSG